MYFEEDTKHEENYSASWVKVSSSGRSCYACLSTDRKLSLLGDYTSLFSKIFEYSPDLRPVLLCWECTAVLRKVKLFKEKVDHAQTVLSYHYLDPDTPPCLSNLNITNIEISTLGGTQNQSELLTNYVECIIEQKIPIENDDLNEFNIKKEPVDGLEAGFDVTNNGFDNDDDGTGFDDDFDNNTFMLGWDSDNAENTGLFIGSTIGVIETNNDAIEKKEKRDRPRKQDKIKKKSFKYEPVKTSNETKISKKRKKLRSSAANALQKLKKIRKEETIPGDEKGKKIETTSDTEKADSKSEIETDNLKNKNTEIEIKQPEELKSEEDDEDDDYIPFSYAKVKKVGVEKKESKEDSKHKKRFKWVSGVKELVKVQMVPVDSTEVKLWMNKDKESYIFKKLPKSCEKCVHSVEAGAHRRYHYKTTERSFRCNICEIFCRTVESRDKHISICHTSLLRCTECGYKCYVPEVMDFHIWKHRQMVQCVSCGELFDNENHFKKNHRVRCDKCGMGFPVKRLLLKHMTRRHKPHTCEQCSKLFPNYNKYMNHVTHFHTKLSEEELEALYCVTCDKQMRNAKQFEYHLNNNPAHASERSDGLGSKEKEKLKCPRCPNVYHYEYSLKRHYLFEHLKEYLHKCDLCQKAYSHKGALMRHIQTIHEGIKAPKDKFCHFCGRGFSLKSILENHIRTHTGERPYQCQYCPSSFAQNTALNVHVKFVHLKEKRGTKERENVVVETSSSYDPFLPQH